MSAFAVVTPGTSVIFTESSAAAFRTSWGLVPTVAIIGGNTNNLGRADEINLYNAANLLEDRLAYDDQTIPGSVRANNVSANTNPEFHGTNNVAQWTLSVQGDARGSYRASGPTTPNSIANPGIAALPVVAVVPEPTTFGMVLGGVFLFASLRNRRRK